MRPTNRLDVLWHDGRVVAELLHTGPIYFRYTPQWLATGHNLSPLTLPFDTRTVNAHTTEDKVPGLVADALPDKWGRTVAQTVFAKLGLGQPTTFKLLAWQGIRGIGALGFRPSLDLKTATPTVNRVHAAALEREARAVLQGELDYVIDNFTAGPTGGGAYPKILVAATADNSLRVRGDPNPKPGETLCILKLDAEGRNPLPAEHAYLDMAAMAGITVPRARILSDENGKKHLLIERFDACPDGTRIHVHSLSGLLGSRRDGFDYSDLFSAITRLACPRADLLQAVRRLLFNLLAGNQDDHEKNHAFVYCEQTRSWRLAPAFDLTHTPGLQRGLRIGGEVVPEWAHLKKWLTNGGLTSEEIEEAYDAVQSALHAWPDLAARNEVPANQTTAITATHRNIARQMSGYSQIRRIIGRG